ncbi:MAG TPA: prepilin-type N-terminal cleavage/methylation domain-containing protein [Mycobacteriales bacterium]|nr:prepilin-type N-terminal cleavage/methylation domain-containing protein [Mycobacteriales bacterium]
MLARIRKAQEKEGGFTLIELLVVMIIIGILAAIAIPVFLNQRKKAQDSAAKADVSTIGKELATYFVDNCTVPTVLQTSGRYELTAAAPAAAAACQSPAAAIVTGTPEADIGKSSDNVVLHAVVAGAGIVDDTHWCVGVTNSKGDKKDYKYSAKNGLQQGVCAATDVS